MTDPMQTIRDDLTYLRALAEDGRDGGSKGGGVMLAAGIIWSSCSMVQWAALAGRVGETAASVAWIVGAVLFVAAMILLLRRTAKPTGGARASGLAWAGVSWAIFTLFAAIALATWRTHDPLLIRFFPSIILAVYGAAWSVGAAVFQARWMRLTCIGSFAAAIVCAWFIADPAQYLIYAAALILLAALPGVVLLRQDQSRALAGALTVMDGFDIDAIDEVIHGRVRLGVMAYLSSAGTADFTDIKRRLQTTDGNLSVHLRRLEDAGYVAVDKSFVGKKPLTRIGLTPAGRQAFVAYLDAIGKLVDETRGG